MIKTANLGYKYRLYPTNEQKRLLDNQMFVSNQAYNICLNLQQKELSKPKEEQQKIKSTDFDKIIKNALAERNLNFKTVTVQQARINYQKAISNSFTKAKVAERNKAIASAKNPKEKKKAFNLGFPKFKDSKLENQSFTWNNQGFQIIEKNKKFKYLRLWRENFKFRFHRDLPENYKITSIVISKISDKYFVSFGIAFELSIEEKNGKIDISKAIGIDLNIHDIALSNGNLIKTESKKNKDLKYNEIIKKLQRKQSKRVLKAKRNRQKIGKNFAKTQRKINRNYKKVQNRKADHYHKITKELTEKFDLIVVEDLKTKNMSAKGGTRKKGLNKSILNTSFYQFLQLLNYKTTMLNDKLFLKVPPHYTSKMCFRCKNINKDLKLSNREYKCPKCGYIEHRDINSAKNILLKGLESLGSGIDLQTINESLSSSVSISNKVS